MILNRDLRSNDLKSLPTLFITQANGIMAQQKQQKNRDIVPQQSTFRLYAAKVLSTFFIFAVFDVIMLLTGVIIYVFAFATQ